MKLDGLTHPKTKELAYKLGIPLPHAIGLLELLFAFVGQQTPEGNVGKWSNAVIAGEAGWDRDPDEFVDALLFAGFLDEDDDHRLLVHDWADHCPNWVHAKLKKAGREIISPDLRADLRRRYKRSEDKRSEDKPKTTSDEPSGSPPAAVEIELPTNRYGTRGETYPVTTDQADEFGELYPAVDVRQELRNMLGWLNSNPSKRKTLAGMAKFVNGWLSREQNRGGRAPDRGGGGSRRTSLQDDLTDTSWAGGIQ